MSLVNNFDGLDNAENAGGAPWFQIVLPQDVDTIPDVILNSIGSAITLNGGALAYNMMATVGTVFWNESPDNVDGVDIYTASLQWVIPKDRNDVLTYAQSINKKGVIAIVEDANGQRRLMGSKLQPATFRRVDRTTGNLDGSARNEHRYEIVITSDTPVPFYQVTTHLPIPQLVCVNPEVSISFSSATPDWGDTLTVIATATDYTPTNYAFYAKNARETKLLQTGGSNTVHWEIDMADTITIFVIATDGTYSASASDSFTITGFITIWEIWRQGNIDELDFPTNSAGTYNCDIYYSDGTSYLGVTTYNDAAWTHTFPSNSERVWVRIEGTYSHIRFPSRSDIVSVVQFGGASIDTNWAFFNCANLESILAIDAPVLNATNALDSIFYNCTRLFYVDWTNWDTATQTSLYRAFYSNQVITPENNVGFTEIDTGNVTSFHTALRQNRGGDLKLRFIDWSSVTTAQQMLVSSDGTTVYDYDQTLQNLLATSPIPSGVSFGFGSSKYTSGGAGETARATLITTYGNTFTDGGSA